jgi:ubiquinone/menaquinone biosynthesis C-methylase UbiE
MKISDAYNEWSAQYDTNANRTRDMEKVAAQSLLKDVVYRNVLELGCGTGKNTEWLIEKADHLTALDFSEKMMEVAKQKVNSPQVIFKQADLTQSWPVDDNQFDLITCSLVLEHIEDLTHIFKEASRALTQGGHFYLTELHPFKQYNGTKARFERTDGTFELVVFVHHVSDYVSAGLANGFKVLVLKEWFDEDGSNKLPRLLSLVFQKNLLSPQTLNL